MASRSGGWSPETATRRTIKTSRKRGRAERAAGCFITRKSRGECKSPPGPGAACARPALSHWGTGPCALGRAHRAVHTGRAERQFPEVVLRATRTIPAQKGPGAEHGHGVRDIPGLAPRTLCLPLAVCTASALRVRYLNSRG